jgi:FMN phosphatase YigB (HAD superfamily)/DNA-binding XRE family transcriptional regulator
MDEVGLGKSLQNARKKAGLTQQQLCQKSGLSYSTLAKIERGAIKSPSIFTIQSIAGALGVTLSDLMGEVSPQSAGQQTAENPKKKSKSGVSFVYFDINGCLVRFFHRAFARLAEDSGAPADMVETTFWHYNDAVCRGELKMDEFNGLFAERLGIDTVDWQKYYMEAIDPIDEMRDLVAWAAEHYHVGLLSNIMPGFIDEMFDQKILPDVTYASIIDSSKVGAIKPEPKIYEIAQDWAGCPPEEILLIDDSRANLMAAERMGWHVLWFDDYRPDESVAHVKDALEIAG